MSEIIIGGNKELIAGKAAVIELEKQLLDYSRSTSESDDVLVFLEPENIPIVEVRWQGTGTVLVSEPGSDGTGADIPIINGTPFRASIARRPKKGSARLLTKLTFQDDPHLK